MKVKLFSSILYVDTADRDNAISELMAQWGRMDLVQHDIPFDHTDYYADEMGGSLYRSIVSFKTLIDRKKLVDAKLLAVKIENSLASSDGRRKLNCDVGYVCDSQLVLATGKNFSHRIYLDKGVFADLTLIYRNKQYQALPWTYPDYAREPLSSLIVSMRERFLVDR